MQILVDQATYDSGKPLDMKQKLFSLKEEGAEIYVCSGARRSVEFGPTARGHGPFHSKLMVVDRRIAYFGNANFSRNSRVESSLVLRMLGPTVQVFETLLITEREKALARA